MNERRLLHYLILVVVEAGFGFMLLYFRYNYFMEVAAAAAASVFYAVWGIWHHSVERRLRQTIVVEYVLVGFMVFLITFLALNL